MIDPNRGGGFDPNSFEALTSEIGRNALSVYQLFDSNGDMYYRILEGISPIDNSFISNTKSAQVAVLEPGQATEVVELLDGGFSMLAHPKHRLIINNQGSVQEVKNSPLKRRRLKKSGIELIATEPIRQLI